MPRTLEQVAADEALTAAIDAVTRAYSDEPVEGILTDYIVIANYQGFDDDGDPFDAVNTLARDNCVAAHRQLGLLEYARMRVQDRLTAWWAPDEAE